MWPRKKSPDRHYSNGGPVRQEARMILNRNPLQLLTISGKRAKRRPADQSGRAVRLVSGGMTDGQIEQLLKLFGGVAIKRQNPDRTELVIWCRGAQ